MSKTLKYDIADIEYAISAYLRPTFLMVVTPEEGCNEIHIVVSCIQFRNKPIQTRIASVFQLLSNRLNGRILEDYLIVIKAFDGPEIEEFLDNVFDEELP